MKKYKFIEGLTSDVMFEAYGKDLKELFSNAAEAMFSVINALLSRCNVIHDMGYLEFGSTSSLEMVTMNNELVAMSRFFVSGIPVNTETIALEVIKKVAHGDSNSMFLTEDHTFENFMQAQFLPKLLDRSRYDSWVEAGAMDFYKRCNIEAKRILSEHQVAPKPDEVLREIDQILKSS